MHLALQFVGDENIAKIYLKTQIFKANKLNNFQAWPEAKLQSGYVRKEDSERKTYRWEVDVYALHSKPAR